MKKSDRKKLESRVNEKLIAMVQTADLDRIYIFLADLSENLTPKQLNAIDLNSMTPLEALKFLNELKKDYNQ